MNYPYQRAYWTRKRMGLLAVLAVLGIIGGETPHGIAGFLGQTFGVVLFAVVLIALYHGLREVKAKTTNRFTSEVK